MKQLSNCCYKKINLTFFLSEFSMLLRHFKFLCAKSKKIHTRFKTFILQIELLIKIISQIYQDIFYRSVSSIDMVFSQNNFDCVGLSNILDA